MAKYTILMSCGHEDTVELLGKDKDRQRKIEYFKTEGLCKECYKKKIREAEENTEASYHISVLPQINNDNGEIVIYTWFEGNTKPIKDTLKEIGYRWGYRESSCDMLSMNAPPMCWGKELDQKDLKSEVEKIKEIFADIKVHTDDSITSRANYQIAMAYKNSWNENKEKIAELEKPVPPEIIRGKKWNQKVYGKKGSYSIYPDGNKTSITDDVAKELMEYAKKKEEYLKKIKDIKEWNA